MPPTYVKILENHMVGKEIRNEYQIDTNDQLAWVGAHSYSRDMLLVVPTKPSARHAEPIRAFEFSVLPTYFVAHAPVCTSVPYTGSAPVGD